MLSYRPASKRSTSRSRGPAEAVNVERDDADLSYQASKGKVPRNWVKSCVSPSGALGGELFDPLRWQLHAIARINFIRARSRQIMCTSLPRLPEVGGEC